MKENEKLTIKSEILGIDNYVLKGLCTFGRDGVPDDELGCEEYCTMVGHNCEACSIQVVINRLGEYENTGLSPGEIENLKAAAKEMKLP